MMFCFVLIVKAVNVWTVIRIVFMQFDLIRAWKPSFSLAVETVHYWDERAAHSQKHFAGPHLCGDALDIIAEHQVILTGSWRRNSTLQVKFLKEKQTEIGNVSLFDRFGIFQQVN